MNAPALELIDVDKRFGGLHVVRGLSFAVKPGRRMALIGPNGAGKTTVFNLISGVYPLSGGQIRMDGTDIASVPSHKRVRYGLARSFQNIRLLPHLTAVENVLLGQHSHVSALDCYLSPVRLMPRSRHRRRAVEALDAAGLGAFAGVRVGGLSYGHQKQIEVVRALMAEPKVLLLDEPAAGLNPTERGRLIEQLLSISARGVTLVVVEHDMHFVDRLCDNVVVLNFGAKIAEGTVEEVRAHPDVMQAYLGSDAEDDAA